MPTHLPANACSASKSGSADSLQQVYLELVNNWSIWEMPLPEAFEVVLNRAGCALGSQRVNIWRLDDQREQLACQRLFDCGR